MNIINNGKYIEQCFKKYSKMAENLVIFENLDFYKTNSKNILNNHLHCDFFGCYQGKLFCLELKETISQSYFNFYKLNPQQKSTLIKINAHQGMGLVGINFISLNKFFVIPIDKLILLKKGGKIYYKTLLLNYEYCSISNNLQNLFGFFERQLNNLTN